ncbi:MAG: hypothetical protein AAFN77_08155 [Planctomycetota bacterium]
MTTKNRINRRFVRRPSRRPQDRAGITLLFVISMIVLFLLMGTTFVVVSNDFFRSSRKRSIKEVHKIDGTPLVEQGLSLLVRGPDMANVNSPLRAHDLMSDQYGYGIRTYVAETPAPTSGAAADGFVLTNTTDQFITFTVTSDPTVAAADGLAFSLLDPAAGAGTIGDTDFLLAGNVLSFVSGPAKGLSTRIVNHRVDNSGANPIHYLTVPSVNWNDGGTIAIADLVDSEIIVNGQDFAGGLSVPGNELFFPNRTGEATASLITAYLDTNSLATNEPWDAADGQNMFLSGFKRDGTFIPSFYRETQEDYVNAAGLVSALGMQQMYAFNDSEDVDSDQDGQEDAFWMDVGFSVQSNGDGLYYKPLIAYHVVDLDGRANLNAHGNLSHSPANRFISTFAATAAANVAPGQGYGPAEVELDRVFATSVGGLTQETVLDNVLAARYAGTTGDGFPGLGTAARTRQKLFGHPNAVVDWAAGNFGTRGNKFASSAMDLGGRFMLVSPTLAQVDSMSSVDNFIDPNYNAFRNGLPVIDMLESTVPTVPEIQISPYEMSFASSPYNDANDSPFTEHELERILRPYDADTALLPQRLWQIANPAGAAADWDEFWLDDSAIANRNGLVTTRSFDVPMIYESIVGKLRTKLAAELGTTDPVIIRNGVRDLMLRTADNCIAPELSIKLKMDINRPFGDGYDNNANGVVDEPGEATTETNIDQGGIAMDLDNDGVVNNATEINARAIFARHLFTLMLLLTDDPTVDLDADGDTDNDDEFLYRRAIAQWCVNVVDFRDADSIMTPVEFDLNPFNGWDVDDDLTTTESIIENTIEMRVVIWGCERPEMLFTETIAGHNRRTEDLSTDPSGSDRAGGDPHFDQRLRPEAFAYFELYNPWTQNSLNQYLDSSLYDAATQGIDLDRVNAGASPVWRMAVERPDRPDGNAATNLSRVVRYVYFTDPDAAAPVGDDDLPTVEVYFPSAGAGTLRPGSQAVVGTLGIEDTAAAGEFVSYFGRLNTKTMADEMANTLDLDMTNQIRMIPGSNQVRCFPIDATNDPRSATLVMLDQGRPGNLMTAAARDFSLSDPFGGYPTVDPMGTAYVQIDDGFAYTQPYNEPFDFSIDNNRNQDDIHAINLVSDASNQIQDGMVENFRIVRLQRLANPLLPWEATTNPYLTIDSMEVDLIAFAGARAQSTDDVYDGGLPTAPNVPQITTGRAVSLERGDEEAGAADQRRQLFGFQRDLNIRAGTPGTMDHFFDVNPTDKQTIGKTNDAYVNFGGTQAFAWLTWNNRPFANNMELMNVPFLAPEELTYTPSEQPDQPIPNPPKSSFSIDDGTITNPYDNRRPNSLAGRYPHLLNFFARNTGGGTTEPEFFRILEYTEVPSRFIGTEAPLSASPALRNPYNFLSRYRVPGKVNLNSVRSNFIWQSVAGNFSTTSTWVEVRDSMMGTANPGTNVSTDFGNPFRPSESFDRTLNDSMAANYPDTTFSDPTPETMLLREDTGAVDQPVFDFASTNELHHTNRNAYFRNLTRQRLANMTTTKSSTFAIWITVGYFEVNPDGSLRTAGGEGVEVGSETGEIQRHRGFYIFDRSIPMAFEPGKNHNIERGILVKTIIE